MEASNPEHQFVLQVQRLLRDGPLQNAEVPVLRGAFSCLIGVSPEDDE